MVRAGTIRGILSMVLRIWKAQTGYRYIILTCFITIFLPRTLSVVFEVHIVSGVYVGPYVFHDRANITDSVYLMDYRVQY